MRKNIWIYANVNKYSCKGCENRKVGCHSNCETYKKYKRLYQDIKMGKLRSMGIYEKD